MSTLIKLIFEHNSPHDPVIVIRPHMANEQRS